MDNFGTRLRKIRKDRDLTIEQLAVLCNSSENVIRSYEKARRRPSSDMLVRICEVLKVHPNYLYQDELSFNAYEDMDVLFQKINNMPPDKYQLVSGIVNLIDEQN